MTPLEVVTALVGGMDATDRAKVAAILGVTAKPAAPPSACAKGHKFRAMARTAGGWFTPSQVVIICERCGRTQRRDA